MEVLAITNKELIDAYNAIAKELLDRAAKGALHLQHQGLNGELLYKGIVCAKCGFEFPLITQRFADIDEIIKKRGKRDRK
jgi:predicted Zn-ribbon and HTH transcriptional regulator